ncbi:DUF3080 family protein [Shewanella sedimentimangrovi]|uniref:DUF3080 family protein n=1 Tax=Shewanella sedimentimangrovi TaxID=2814293 RepID=A0ABX7R502_9GAMM|nr:DUF3080 family protein [Shewanella sedimentimangrovi]QSX38927.1 DUF3080 family protein [Shewanella sedimentimangrovi]
MSACSPNAGDLWLDYQDRLERVLEQSLSSKTTPSDVPVFASPPKRRWPDAQVNISLLQLANIAQCPLGRLIAEHNNSLGRVAQPSQRLAYQLNFIRLAPECITSLNGAQSNEARLRSVLQAEREAKIGSAMQDLHFMLEQDSTLRQNLIPGHGLDSQQPLGGLSETQLAFNVLLTLKQAILRADWQQLNTESVEQALGELHRSDLIAGYMLSLSQSLTALERINKGLSQAKGFLCQPGRNKNRQEILLNVLNKVFIGRIHPFLGALDTIQFELGPALLDLYTGTAYEAQIQFYFSELPDSAMFRLKAAIKEHIALWQQLQQSCRMELAPGSAGGEQATSTE